MDSLSAHISTVAIRSDLRNLCCVFQSFLLYLSHTVLTHDSLDNIYSRNYTLLSRSQCGRFLLERMNFRCNFIGFIRVHMREELSPRPVMSQRNIVVKTI